MNKKQLLKNGYKEIHDEITIEKASKGGFFIVLPIIIALAIIYLLINGGHNFLVSPWRDYFKVAIIFIIGFAIHEGLHILLFKNISRNGRYEFSLDPNWMKPYVRGEEPIKIVSYKIFKGVPLLVTGIIPYVISLFVADILLMIASILLIGMCGVDIYKLIKLRKIKGDSYILDDEYTHGHIIFTK